MISQLQVPFEDAISFPQVFDLFCEVAVTLRPYNPHLKLAIRDGLQYATELDLALNTLSSLPQFDELFDPMDRSAQMLIAPDSAAFEVREPMNRADPGHGFQQPKSPTYTSTYRNGTSNIQRAIENRTNDWAMFHPPLIRALVHVEPQARIYEVSAPADWRRLCERYPSTSIGYPYTGETVPDWFLVARDWDGVHLSLGGLLRSLHVQEGVNLRSVLWEWDTERTLWLRQAWSKIEPMPALKTFRPTDLGLAVVYHESSDGELKQLRVMPSTPQ